MKRPNLAAAVYLLLVFLSGVLVGGFAYRLYTLNTVVASTSKAPRSPEEYRKRVVEEMRTRLKLSDGQLQQLQNIMDETRQRFHDFREKTKPQFDAIQTQQKALQDQQRAIGEEQHQQIRAMLNDTQRAEYDKMLEERRKLHEQRQQQKKGF